MNRHETGSAISTMQTQTVLFVDDDARQRKLGRLQLLAAGFKVQCAADAEEAFAIARRTPPTVIISDVVMGETDGFGFCRRIRDEPAFDDVPVVLISAQFKEAADQRLAARVGANELVSRTPDFGAEIAALRRSLSEGPKHRPERPDVGLDEEHTRRIASKMSALLSRAQRSEQRYQLLVDNANDNIAVIDPRGIILEANRQMEETVQVARGGMAGRHISEFAPPERLQWIVETYDRHRQAGSGKAAVPIRATDGTISFIEFSTSVVEIEGVAQTLSIGRDITESLRVAEALRASEERHRQLLERLPLVVWSGNVEGKIGYVTPNVLALTGFSAAEVCARGFALWRERTHPDDREALTQSRQAFLSNVSDELDVEYRWQRKDGQWIWMRARSSIRYEIDGVQFFDAVMMDVTKERQLEDSLRQAQKIEAIGLLAGGVAHDFNNILAVILTNCEFLLDALAAEDPRRLDALDISGAANRAVTLTRQLTAFSRKQVLEPKVVALNSAIADVWKMIQRLIGEDINVATAFDPTVGNTCVDVTQMAQVLMNLVINARDAMPGGGTLTVETANVDFADSYAASHAGAKPGHYVMLAVSDSGIGMDEKVKARIFEPFFTTKEQGKGTGLGLSTVYGIVKQSGGYICAYSEPGHGSVFKVYLPRVDARAEPSDAAKKGENLHSRGERILLVEDELMVRNAVARILKAQGYTVVTAENPDQAFQRFEEDPQIDLVLSDVILPGASGPDIAARLAQLRPGLKTLFMSGFTDHAIVRQGVLQPGVNFIQKPFTPTALAHKLRAVFGD
jgi:two-component system cell cycle sensor histidine kinase/response regulator CckA